MKTRFYQIVILITLLFGAWTYLAHFQQEGLVQNYEDLARLPIYTFVSDTTLVSPLLEKLAQIPDLAAVEHETGLEAADELITAYNLPLEERMISDYSFPDLITITFPPSQKGIAAREAAMEILRADLSEDDIDSQSTVYTKLRQALGRKKMNFWAFLAFAGLMMLKLLIDIRMSFELKRYHRQMRKPLTVVDMMRLSKARTKRGWVLMIAPVAVVILLYYAVAYFQLWQGYNLWRSFVSMALAAVLAAVAQYFSFKSYLQEDALSMDAPAAEPVPTPGEQDA